jgi:hypothetical protein
MARESRSEKKPMRHAREALVDRVALDLLPVLQRGGAARAVLGDRCQGHRLAVRRFDRQRAAGQLVVRNLVEHRHADLEEHPLLPERPVGELIADNDIAFVVVCRPDELTFHGHDLRYPGLGYLHGWRLLGLRNAEHRQGPEEAQADEDHCMGSVHRKLLTRC